MAEKKIIIEFKQYSQKSRFILGEEQSLDQVLETLQGLLPISHEYSDGYKWVMVDSNEMQISVHLGEMVYSLDEFKEMDAKHKAKIAEAKKAEEALEEAEEGAE